MRDFDKNWQYLKGKTNNPNSFQLIKFSQQISVNEIKVTFTSNF